MRFNFSRKAKWLLWLFSFTPFIVTASHILGGDVTIEYLGKAGYYRVMTNLYLSQGNIPTKTLTISVYKKNTGVLVQTLQVDLQENLPLTLSYQNIPCVKSSGYNMILARYSRDIQFDVKKFLDPDGYYFIYSVFGRTTGDNLQPAGGVGAIFRLYFPPMQQGNGADLINSSPQFTSTSGNFGCVGNLFSFSFNAVDKDGDELRYYLVSPLQSYTPSGNIFTNVDWLPGYTPSNPIKGDPPLSIDQNTGKLTMKATQTGLFIFTVEVQEWRQGQQIGAIRRDFLVPVIDCKVNIPPPAVILYQNKTASEIDLCSGTSAILTVDSNPDWAYQWKKDGVELSGSTSPRLTANTTGVYSVTKRFARKCGGDTTSAGVKIRTVPVPSVKISTSAFPFCTGDTVTLKAEGTSDFRYTWQKNGKLINGITGPMLQSTENGVFSVEGGPLIANCTGKDTIRIMFNARPKVSIMASATSFCAGDSVQLSTVDSVGFQYTWMPSAGMNSLSRQTVRSEGTYQVKVTNLSGCSAVSAPINIRQLPLPVIQFDALRPICSSETTPVLVAASPGGGVFSGTGITGNTFNPQGLLPGVYPVTYQVKSADGCLNQQTRMLSVVDGPFIELADTFLAKRGEPVQLMATAIKAVKFSWTPMLYFTRNEFYSLQPSVQPPKSITYTLTAYSADGCSTEAKTQVVIKQSLYMPTAFTPNGDNQNDYWEIKNSNLYPNCEVRIYNRWGQLMYESTGYNVPWDGTFQHKKVTGDVYTYEVIPDKGELPVTGTVLVLY